MKAHAKHKTQPLGSSTFYILIQTWCLGTRRGGIIFEKIQDWVCFHSFKNFLHLRLFINYRILFLIIMKAEAPKATRKRQTSQERFVFAQCELTVRGPIWWDSLLCGAYGLIVTVNLSLCTLRHCALILLTSVFSRSRGPNFDTFSCPCGINVVFLRYYSSACSVKD